MSRAGRIDVLDSVRGLAAFIVVIHHCFITRPVYSDFFFTHWQTGATGPISWIFLYTPARLVWSGYEAVTLFYILSGLVLALPWMEGRAPGYRDFAIRRMFRLYIPYVVAIILAGALNLFFLHRAAVAGASKWVNEMTWTHPVTLSVIIDHLALIGHHATINGVTHTLIWEIRVSLIFPLLIWPLMRWGYRGALGLLAVLVALIVGLQVFFGDIHGLGDLLISAKNQSLMTRAAFELQWTAYYSCFFVFGSLMAAHLEEIRGFFARFGGWLGFVFLVSGLLIFQGHWSQWHAVQELMVAVGSILIMAASLSRGAIENALLHRFPRYLGKISFSLYLVHVPLVLALTILTHNALPLPVLIAIVVPVSIGLAVVFDRFVTVPSAALGYRMAQASRNARIAPRPVLQGERL
jgi:peptidoglycan/LPS O-acetylase OafA/YrhL